MCAQGVVTYKAYQFVLLNVFLFVMMIAAIALTVISTAAAATAAWLAAPVRGLTEFLLAEVLFELPALLEALF